MIKVFLHISVHIGTELSELAFPGTERHTRGKGSWGLTSTGTEVQDRATKGGRDPHFLTQAWGRGQGRRPGSPGICPSDPRILPTISFYTV